MTLTEETMKLATLAGLDFKDATSQMTAALRGFKLEMSEGERVTDVYAEVAAHAAATVNDLSQAMSATSNIAHSAGMSFENTTAMLATMIEATQEAPKNLGTALKTVIARFTELKENVAGTADSEFEDLDYNKVDKALKSVGVQLKDTNGQFRNLDDVFFELGKKWNSLDRNAQRYVATIAAGSRQQSRFIALMENYERTMELVDVA
jgi:TP901 family phage tail tape measure protein